MREIFKDIPGYEGLYQASTLGRIKSLERVVIRKNGRQYNVIERILKDAPDKDGYRLVALSKDGNLKSRRVHILMGIAFLGYNPQTHDCDHVDGDTGNNIITNLEVLTKYEHANKNYYDKETSSKYPGVTWAAWTNRWRAICRGKHIGYYNTEESAYNARNLALNELSNVV